METSSVILSPKRQKLDGGEEMEGRRKELFNLPGEILLAIISLLETMQSEQAYCRKDGNTYGLQFLILDFVLSRLLQDLPCGILWKERFFFAALLT